MLDHWEISTDKVHLVLRDNAANNGKSHAKSIASFSRIFYSFCATGCRRWRVLTMPVIDVVATCRTIVDHFKHLSVAYGHFWSIQEHSGVPQHCLQEDVLTRWNSSLYMVKSVIEQEVSLAAYVMETGIVTLSPTQLD